jgi:hypothetical protein
VIEAREARTEPPPLFAEGEIEAIKKADYMSRH